MPGRRWRRAWRAAAVGGWPRPGAHATGPDRLAAFALVVALATGAAGGPAAPPRLGPAPNFALTTQRHERLWLTQLRDRVVVLTFFCATCPACPEVLPALFDLTRVLREGAGRRVFFVAVSLDPRRDTPAALRAFARERGADPAAWLFLTGKATEVDVVARRYGVEVRRGPGAPSHDCLAVLIDGAGAIRGRYDAAGLDRLRADLEALLAD